MTFDNDIDYSFPLFSNILKKERRRKGDLNSKKWDQQSCLSARSFKDHQVEIMLSIFHGPAIKEIHHKK
jgi:hypothetical protein